MSAVVRAAPNQSLLLIVALTFFGPSHLLGQQPSAPTTQDAAASEADETVSGIESILARYNEERAEITAEFELEPFDTFELDMVAPLEVADGTATIHLRHANRDRRLSLPNADKLLFQLVITHVFVELDSEVDVVAITIQFNDGERPVLMSYRYADWVGSGRGGIEAFWEDLECQEKDFLWSTG